MKRMYQVIGAVCFVLVVFFGTFAVKADAASGVSAISYEGQRVYTEAFRVLELVNEQRAANGLKPLKMDLTLLETGMKRAEECRIFHSHTRPNGEQYTTLFPHTTYWGENIAIGYPTAEEVVNAWMNSPGHRANILNSRFSSIGIGVFCHNGISAWTQAFSSNDTTGASVISNRDVTAKVSILDENYSLGTYPDTISLNAGATQTVSLHAWSWESGLYFRVYPTGISYRSGNTAVAKVDTQGKVTAVGVGSTTITVSVSGCNKTVSIPVTVACKAHTYAGGVCTACKYEFPLQVKNLSGTYTVIAKSANIWSKPYSTGASKLVRTAAKGTDVTVTGMVTNSAGSLWYKLSDGNWVYSSNVEKKSATYREIDVVPCSGIYAISSNGANIWSKPFTDGTSKLLTTYKKGTQLAIVAKVVNSAGSTWIQLSEGGWVYFGNVTRKTAITYNPENVVTVSGT